nr:hypothetical protein [Armatimonas sp.]
MMDSRTSEALNFLSPIFAAGQEGLEVLQKALASQQELERSRAEALRSRYQSLKGERSGRGGPMSHPKDARVPLVNQAGQLDPEDTEHLAYLDGLLRSKGWASGLSPDSAALADAVIVCFLFLEDLLRGEVHPDVISWLNGNHIDQSFTFDLTRRKYMEGATITMLHVPIPFEDLQIQYWSTGVTFQAIVSHHLRNEIKARIEMLETEPSATTPALAMRCEDCLSAFLITRGGQRFCSNRCGLRHGERRRRKERESIYQE